MLTFDMREIDKQVFLDERKSKSIDISLHTSNDLKEFLILKVHTSYYLKSSTFSVIKPVVVE